MRDVRGTHRAAWGACVLALLALLALGGCSLRYAEGQSLEAQGRWEEAMLAYRDAVIDSPGDPDYRTALERAEHVVARDNFDRYKAFLAEKSFHKAYDRLLDAARQDPAYAPVQEELGKWERVLVGGQVNFKFKTSQSNVTLAEQITLIVRINTPNPGETIDAPVDIDTGTFYAEDLLYNRPSELLATYSINSIGVELVYGRTRIKQFTSKEFQRFINFRTPVVDNLNGSFATLDGGDLKPILAQRHALPRVPVAGQPEVPPSNPHYSLQIEGQQVRVEPERGAAQPVYTPRFLYLNRQDRRVFVDFGRYEVSLPGLGRRWELRRLPVAGDDYFPGLSRNIALQPYFFYREGVFTFVPSRSG